MLVAKLQKGLYEVIDDQRNNYRIEDRLREDDDASLVMAYKGNDIRGRWCIFEQAEGDWVYLDGNKSLKDCLGVIETWSAASQLGI